MISLRSQAWLPSVSTLAPAAKSAAAISGARPKPWLAFSALTTTSSALSAAFSPGRRAATASRPVRPTTSPRNRTRIPGPDRHDPVLGRDCVERPVMGTRGDFVHLLRGISDAHREDAGQALDG